MCGYQKKIRQKRSYLKRRGTRKETQILLFLRRGRKNAENRLRNNYHSVLDQDKLFYKTLEH